MLRFVSLRRFANFAEEEAKKIASRLLDAFPAEDPGKLKPAKVERLLKSQAVTLDRSSVDAVLEQWKFLYERHAHDSAYEDMADPGELCDGELPSWRNARLSVERDPTFIVPDVSASEAAWKIKKPTSDPK